MQKKSIGDLIVAALIAVVGGLLWALAKASTSLNKKIKKEKK